MHNVTKEGGRPHHASRERDDIVLADGTDQSTPEVLVCLGADPHPALIEERIGVIPEQPPACRAHKVPAIRLTGAIAGHQS